MVLAGFAPLIAQDADRYNRGLQIFQWGVTGVGIAVLVAAAAMLLQKPKPGASSGAVTAQRVVGVVLAVIGLGIVAYAWIGFSPM